jgi:hypothetical protein
MQLLLSSLLSCAPGVRVQVQNASANAVMHPLQRHSIRDSALGSMEAGDRVPAWLEKWAALTLCFVEEEQALLPPQLCAIPPPQAFYTPSSAVVEARGAGLLLWPALSAYVDFMALLIGAACWSGLLHISTQVN